MMTITFSRLISLSSKSFLIFLNLLFTSLNVWFVYRYNLAKLQIDSFIWFNNKNFLQFIKYFVFKIFEKCLLIMQFEVANQSLKFDSERIEIFKWFDLFKTFIRLQSICTTIWIIKYLIQIVKYLIRDRIRLDRILEKSKD